MIECYIECQFFANPTFWCQHLLPDAEIPQYPEFNLVAIIHHFGENSWVAKQ